MATAAERLVEAENAYHSLLLGQAAAEVRDAGGVAITYTKADIPRLSAYIQSLKAEISGASTTRLPMRPIFG